MQTSPYPENLPDNAELRLALGALQRMFISILVKSGFSALDLMSAELHFMVQPSWEEGSMYGVRATLKTHHSEYQREFALPDDLTLARSRRVALRAIDFTVHKRDELP